MVADAVLETIAASGSSYFSSVVADVATAMDSAATTAVSGSSYFSSAVAVSVPKTVADADVMNVAKFDIC